MGFYFRKSVRVGPLRFNFSKSGIGVSAGIPGFRVGTGPRGHYVHAGRGGFYYRATIPSGDATQTRFSGKQQNVHDGPLPMPSYDPTVDAAQEIESGSVLGMTDDTAEALLRELNERRRRWRLAPLVLLIGVAVVLGARQPWGDRAAVVAGACVVIAAAATYMWDQLRKSTVIMYDMEPEAVSAYERMSDAVAHLGSAQRIWHISTQAKVRDAKYHAGANSVISRKQISVSSGLPRFVKCNLDVPMIAVGKQTLYFFPDRMLVFDAGSVGAVSYSNLKITRRTTQFIESDGVPGDSRVIGHTWRYVNKKGGPDRRFSDNTQIPICEYEELHLSSGTGLNELLQVSHIGAGDALELAVRSHGSRTRGQ